MTTTTLEPATTQDLDIRTLEHLERDWAIPCEMRIGPDEIPCGEPAVWWLICRECGHALAECDQHRVIEANHFAGVGVDPRATRVFVCCTRCTRCTATVPASEWASLFIVEPIGVLP